MGRHITKKEAEKTALKIQHYWNNRGKSVNVWTERSNFTDHVVRSDMINGSPRENLQ